MPDGLSTVQNSTRPHLERHHGHELRGSDIREISDIFRETFNNAPYGQYLLYPSVGEPISAQEVFDTDSYIPRDQLDAYNPTAYPVHPTTGEHAVQWTHPERTELHMYDKMRHHAHAVRLRRPDGGLEGVSIGYTSPLREAFGKEEWESPYKYARGMEGVSMRNFSEFHSRIRNALGDDVELNPYSRVFVISFMLTTPQSRGMKNYISMLKGLMHCLPNSISQLPIMAEVKDGSLPHIMFRSIGGNTVQNYIEDGHHIVVGRVADMLELVNNTDKDIQKLFVDTKRGVAPLQDMSTGFEAPEDALERYGYIPSAEDSPKVDVKRTDIGRGVFAREPIAAGETIAVFDGPVYEASKLSDLPNHAPLYTRDHVVQVGEREYVHAAHRLVELINHSCDPNCGISDSVTVVAMRDIEPGEELRWDYAMTENSDWHMEGCNCGSKNCRGTITAHRDLPLQQREKYHGFTSPWLRKAEKVA